MAIIIRTIPTLEREEAIRFDDKAKNMSKKKSSVDFSKQVHITAQILAKTVFEVLILKLCFHSNLN